ncbi:hypothetical protein AGLY_008889 [Aphis glycines]|uniref:Uncharacterized protein n=1 Tax=Aphis glycines TaxID=307491 RepID=A0A6G0TJ56_APHGL|nr:hypothetical protein AGLY_008889 [Aphis glycines]
MTTYCLLFSQTGIMSANRFFPEINIAAISFIRTTFFREWFLINSSINIRSISSYFLIIFILASSNLKCLQQIFTSNKNVFTFVGSLKISMDNGPADINSSKYPINFEFVLNTKLLFLYKLVLIFHIFFSDVLLEQMYPEHRLLLHYHCQHCFHTHDKLDVLQIHQDRIVKEQKIKIIGLTQNVQQHIKRTL